MTQSSSRTGARPGKPAPRYETIETHLARAIRSGALGPGTVLTEGPIAELFGTSRTPVRTALNDLNSKGVIDRFDGRGFIVPGGAPQRAKITHADLELSPDRLPELPTPGAERIAQDFESSIALALPFGLFRVSEQAAADHYGVSRPVIRELLSRFQDRGLIRKDARSHWVVGPLTSRDVAQFYDIRARLEPLALRDASGRIAPSEVERMRAQIEDVLSGRVTLSARRLEALETELHQALLGHAANPYLGRMIHQSQIVFVINRLFAGTVGAAQSLPAIEEHRMVLDFLARKALPAAENALETHLLLAKERTRQRLKAISVFPRPDLAGFLSQTSD